MTSPLSLHPVGILHSPYKEKFAVPRQPGLVPSARARLELLPPCNDAQTLRGIEQFSHLWLIFQFHECAEQGWHPTVRPPRLGGNERVGVFASRSPFRPNGLGLSVVQLLGVHQQGPRLWLKLAGIDQEEDLVSCRAIEPIQTLKTNYLGSKNPRLHTDEILIALSSSAAENETAAKALRQLSMLKGCDMHSTVILSSVDTDTIKRLGMYLTCEPVYEEEDRKYHKR